MTTTENESYQHPFKRVSVLLNLNEGERQNLTDRITILNRSTKLSKTKIIEYVEFLVIAGMNHKDITNNLASILTLIIETGDKRIVTEGQKAPMTDDENLVMGHLAAATVIFGKLESTHSHHNMEFATAIHHAQRVVTQRMCQREYPGSYPTYRPNDKTTLLEQLSEQGIPIEAIARIIKATKKPALKVCEIRIEGEPGTRALGSNKDYCHGEGYQDCDTCARRDPSMVKITELKDCGLRMAGEPGTVESSPFEVDNGFCQAEGYIRCDHCQMRDPSLVKEVPIYGFNRDIDNSYMIPSDQLGMMAYLRKSANDPMVHAHLKVHDPSWDEAHNSDGSVKDEYRIKKDSDPVVSDSLRQQAKNPDFTGKHAINPPEGSPV